MLRGRSWAPCATSSRRPWSSEPEIAALEFLREAFERALRIDDPEALYEQAPCGYLSAHPDGLLLKVNQTFLAWTGHSTADLVETRSFTDLLTRGSQIYYETHVRPLLLMQGQVSEIAIDLVRADGSTMPCLVNAVTDHADDGTPAVTRMAVFDATERRRYERELLAQKERAEESERRCAEVARTLQETLMPPRDARIEGLDVATGYRPAGSGDEIGGDFYDIFEVADGDWVVTIGDVSGKGVQAAVVATLARHTIRAVATSGEGPAGILRQLNQVLLGHPSGRFLTAAVLRMRRVEDWWDVSMSLGGHPPAISLHADGVPHPIGESSHLVGAFDFAAFGDVRFEFGPGTTLVLHTDGVTEAHDPREPGRFYGEERLMRLLNGAGGSAQALVDRVLQDVLDFQDGRPRDDIAIVALQVPDHLGRRGEGQQARRTER